MKKLFAITFVSLIVSGTAFAEVGPTKSANCKDIIEGIRKKQQQQQAQPQPDASAPGRPASGDAR